METLAENLKEINKTRDASLWIDFVVVLDKGYIGYALQPIFQQDLIGWMAGTSGGDDFMIPALYVHLVQSEIGERALNFFFVRLMAHLTFFRKISAVDLMTLLRSKQHFEQTIQGYQYNLEGQLVDTEVGHQSETFENPKVRFNLYHAKTRKFIGQMCRLPWQDGAVITFSVLFDPSILFRQFLAKFKLKGQLLQNKCNGALVWTSNVLPITEEKFIEVAEDIHSSVISKRDTNDDTPPPLTI